MGKGATLATSSCGGMHTEHKILKQLAGYLKLYTVICEPADGILRTVSGKEGSSELLVPPWIISRQSLQTPEQRALLNMFALQQHENGSDRPDDGVGTDRDQDRSMTRDCSLPWAQGDGHWLRCSGHRRRS